MAVTTWENALQIFGPSNYTVTTRDNVADIKNPWFALTGSNGDGSNGHFAAFGGTDDVTVPTMDYVLPIPLNSGSSSWMAYFGFTLDYRTLNDPTKPWLKWQHSHEDVFHDLLWGPSQNDTTSVWSFDAASAMLRNYDTWLTTSESTVQGWADSVNAPGTDWQGTAAGVFQHVLLSYVDEFKRLQFNMRNAQLANAIDNARHVLWATHSGLYKAFTDWQSFPESSLFLCVKEALTNAFAGASWQTSMGNGYTIVDTVTFQTSCGTAIARMDTNVDASANTNFWTGVQLAAFTIWKNGLINHLDNTVQRLMGDLGIAYGGIMDILPAAVTSVQLNLNQGANLNLNLNDNANANGDLNANGNLNDKLNADGGGGGQLPGGGNGKLPGGGNGKLPGGGNGTLPGGPNGGLPNSHGTLPGGPNGSPGGDVPLLGPDGKPLHDKNGNPIMVPPGSTIGKNGEVLGPDGQPLMIGGKPYIAPKGSTVGTQPQQPGGGTLPGNDPMKVPPGSKINADGTVTGPDGKILTDPNGNKIVLGKGDTIGTDGTILGPDGKPISQSAQLLADEEAAMFGGQPQFGSSGQLPGDFGGGGGLFDTSGMSKSLATSSGVVGPNDLKGGITGDTSRMVDSGALTPEQAAAEQAATAAAEEAGKSELAQMQGQSVQTASGEPPMMPPMGGMGAGMGGAGQGQDRQRTTWLSEDEETWGTDSEAVSGVIGR